MGKQNSGSKKLVHFLRPETVCHGRVELYDTRVTFGHQEVGQAGDGATAVDYTSEKENMVKK